MAPVATWKLALTTLPSSTAAQATVNFLDKPSEVTYTRRRNSYCELTCSVQNVDDLTAVQGQAYKRCLLAYRNGVLRFNGQIVDYRETKDSIEFTAKDPFYNMSWRRVWHDPGYTGLDTAEVAARLIEEQNSYTNSALYPNPRTTFLRRGTIGAVPDAVFDWKFSDGDVVAEKIVYLARVPNSFLFTIDPVDGETDYLGVFNAHSSYDTVQAKAMFQFGVGTLDNCVDYQRVSVPLVSKANIVGDNGKVASAESVSGTDNFGRWEDERGQVAIDDEAQLKAIADDYVMDNVQYAVSLACGPECPQLFTDFDVTDKVPVAIRRRGATIAANMPVYKAVIKLDPDSGAESLDELVIVDEDAGDAP